MAQETPFGDEQHQPDRGDDEQQANTDPQCPSPPPGAADGGAGVRFGRG